MAASLCSHSNVVLFGQGIGVGVVYNSGHSIFPTVHTQTQNMYNHLRAPQRLRPVSHKTEVMAERKDSCPSRAHWALVTRFPLAKGFCQKRKKLAALPCRACVSPEFSFVQ